MTNAVSYVYQKATQQTVKNRTRGKNVSQSLRLSYRRDWETKYSLEVSTNGNIGYNHSRSTNSSASNLDTYHFSYGGSVNLQFPWGMSFWTDISEQSRRGYADHSMNTDKVIWNASISQRLLKQRNLTLSIRAYDILQQRDNISRNISATARTDSRNEAVNSYFLFSVNWRFGKFGGRSQNRMRGFDGERMREEGQRPEGRGMRGDGERPSIRVESGGGGFGGGMRGM